MWPTGGGGRKVLSADRHVVRVWDANSGAAFTSIQPQAPGINDVLHWPGSGLLMLGMDQPKIEVRARAHTHVS
jgi:ribosome biogenesis protein ENP2